MKEEELEVTEHRQVHIQHGPHEADVDEGIAQLILALWKLDIRTVMSCQDNNGRVWINFLSPVDAENFLDAVTTNEDIGDDTDCLNNRIAGEVEPEDWEDFRLHRRWDYSCIPTDFGLDPEDDTRRSGPPDFYFDLSVRFPLTDLSEAVHRVESVVKALEIVANADIPELTLSAEDELAEKYAQVCDVVERNYHGWPLEHDGDGDFSHTSKEARAAALRIFEILDVYSTAD